MRLIVTKERAERLLEPLSYAWGAASLALLVAVVVMRVVDGPVHGALWSVAVLVWGAPLWLMFLNVVLGWVWFALWLLARPFKRLRESRFIHPERW